MVGKKERRQTREETEELYERTPCVRSNVFGRPLVTNVTGVTPLRGTLGPGVAGVPGVAVDGRGVPFSPQTLSFFPSLPSLPFYLSTLLPPFSPSLPLLPLTSCF